MVLTLPGGPGAGWGAWELGVRYSGIQANAPAANFLSFYTPGFVPQYDYHTDQFTFGVNWYLNYWVKYQFNVNLDRLQQPSTTGQLPQTFYGADAGTAIPVLGIGLSVSRGHVALDEFDKHRAGSSPGLNVKGNCRRRFDEIQDSADYSSHRVVCGRDRLRQRGGLSRVRYDDGRRLRRHRQHHGAGAQSHRRTRRTIQLVRHYLGQHATHLGYISDRIGLAVVVFDTVNNLAVNAIQGSNAVTGAGNQASPCAKDAAGNDIIPPIVSVFGNFTRYGCRTDMSTATPPGPTFHLISGFGANHTSEDFRRPMLRLARQRRESNVRTGRRRDDARRQGSF